VLQGARIGVVSGRQGTALHLSTWGNLEPYELLQLGRAPVTCYNSEGFRPINFVNVDMLRLPRHWLRYPKYELLANLECSIP
jgi:hypothetical protein